MSDVAFMHIVGIVEMLVGLAILTRWTRIGSYIAAAWLIAIAGNLLMTGRFFDVAVRDLEIGLAAYTLARLTELKQISGVTVEVELVSGFYFPNFALRGIGEIEA